MLVSRARSSDSVKGTVQLIVSEFTIRDVDDLMPMRVCSDVALWCRYGAHVDVQACQSHNSESPRAIESTFVAILVQSDVQF